MSRRQGRQVIHLVRDFLLAFEDATADQRQVLFALASWSPTIRPGFEQVRRLLRIRKSAIGKAIKYWLGLRVLVLVTPGRPHQAAEYSIDPDQMAALIGSGVEPNEEASTVPASEPKSEAASVPDGSLFGSRPPSLRFPHSSSSREVLSSENLSRKTAPVGASEFVPMLEKILSTPPFAPRQTQKQLFARYVKNALTFQTTTLPDAMAAWLSRYPQTENRHRPRVN